MKYKNLVVNGCSYMESYALGKGHIDLAMRLGIDNSSSLAIGGSSNNRIIRTTLKHSFTVNEPTFYVLGVTFINRQELPILKYLSGEEEENSFEGRWTNPQNQQFSNRWEHFWTEKDTDKFVDLKLKSEIYSLIDYTEDLMYRLLSLINDLCSRGNQVLIFNQADKSLLTDLRKDLPLLKSDRLKLLSSTPNLMYGLSWLAVPWQHEQGVPSDVFGKTNPKYPPPNDDIKHRRQGDHQKLNEFLTNYINEYKILE